MVNEKFLSGMLVTALVLGMTVIGCDNVGGSGDGGGSGFLGDELNFSGQVYLEQWDETETSLSISYPKFTGNLAVFDDYGGYGAVTNGKLSYSIATPEYLETLDFEDEFGSEMYNNFTSSEDVRGVILYSLETDSDDYPRLYYDNAKVSGSPASFSYTYENVIYIYVENDVTVSGKGKVNTDTWEYEGIICNEVFTSKNFTLALKAGWNAVYGKSVGKEVIKQTTRDYTATATISMGNPSLKWTLSEHYSEDETSPPGVIGGGDSGYPDDYSLMLGRSVSNTPQTGNSGFKPFHQMRHNRIFSAYK